MWLNERDLDIRCVRLGVYKHEVEIFLDVQQVIPLPEAPTTRFRSGKSAVRLSRLESIRFGRKSRARGCFRQSHENPRRPDTHGFAAFQVILDAPGIQYEDWVERYRSNRPQDKSHPYRHLKWDLERERVLIQDPQSTAKGGTTDG